MPELPEVETTRLGVAPLVKGKTVKSVTIYNASLRWPVPECLVEILTGQILLDVGRRSKYLLFRFKVGTLIVHLGMTGHLRVCTMNTDLRKHDHIEVLFSDGTLLRYNDSRRFGAIFWTDRDPYLHPRLAALGPEPFSSSFNATYLYQRSRGRHIAIKPFIMDAKIVVGIGNIYANEALFRAAIDPRRPAGKVSRAAMSRLVRAICTVLDKALAAGGTTIRDFTDTQGRPGYFKHELQVYDRKDLPCQKCHCPIKYERLGQRSTFFCPNCQH